MTIFDTFFALIMRILVVGVLTGMSIVFGQSLASAHEQSWHSHIIAHIIAHNSSDTLEIRSGAAPASTIRSSTATTAPSPKPLLQPDAATSPMPSVLTASAQAVDTLRSPTKKLSRKEILKIPLEELLDLPMETVLEYAKVIDSIKFAGGSSVRGRSGVKSKRTNVSPSKVPDTQILDKLNAALQQLQEQKQTGKKTDRKSTRLNSSHLDLSRMPSSA